MIYLLGRLPPPVGGVTTFNNRLLRNISNPFLTSSIHSLSSLTLKDILIFIAKPNSSSLLVVSTTSFFLQILSIIVAKLRGPRSLFILHLSAAHFLSSNALLRFFQICILKTFTLVYTLNADSLEYLQDLGVYNTILGSSFLPPASDELADSAPELQHLSITTLSQHSCNSNLLAQPFILSGAWKPCLDSEQNDIYGINSLIESYIQFLALVDNPPNLVISDPNGLFRQLAISTLPRKLKESILCRIFFINSPHAMWRLIRISSLFVRNTLTDGDSISIREALYFNTPVLATDVVSRPYGVTVCSTVDSHALYSKWISIKPRSETDIISINTSVELFPLYLIQ
jgi:hypothetical protein